MIKEVVYKTRYQNSYLGYQDTKLTYRGFPSGSAVKNLPPMQETQVQSLGWENPLEEGMATHSSILAWRIPMDRGAWWAMSCGVTVMGATSGSDVTPN